MQCPACGYAAPGVSPLCPQCGRKSLPAGAPPPRAKTSPLFLRLLVYGSLAFGVALFFKGRLEALLDAETALKESALFQQTLEQRRRVQAAVLETDGP
ncbi:MAG TPA: hypothetical protein DCM05_01400 [Elusimicrobia bacterium]|nr:hypothetical protein [Elusimicrobiota bacterium]